ncbi:MAG TPA: TonB-dependent receptor [Terriglobales bacterium]|nr:TonB-dependent receptor [Terriglobales bacterium]
MFRWSLLVLLVFATAFAVAQSASISGTVTDVSGAVVIGAEISVVNVDTMAARTVTSGDTGAYAVTNLPVGNYRVEIKKENFTTFRVNAIALTVDQAQTINAALQPGSASSTTIDVSAADLPPVDLETSQISNLVESAQMQALPLITRNPYELVLLSPGTFVADNRLGGISVNGGRTENSNFLLDGVDNNDTSVPGFIGGALGANPDSTEEFRVITDNFNAEFGRNTGAIIDVVTKSGTNEFHGAAYYFGRWNGFGGARDWFNPGEGPDAGPMNPYIRHQFGFSIGGPIIKNKTFFFFNNEWNRFVTALTGQATVPTTDFLTGQFNYTYTPCPTPTTCQPPVTVPIDLTQAGANNAFALPLDPTMAKVFAIYAPFAVPASQSFDGIEGNVFFPSTSRVNSYAPVLKIDHKLTDKHAVNVRFGYNHGDFPNACGNFLPGVSGCDEKAITYGLSAQLTSTLSNSLLNNFQFGLNHIYAPFTQPAATTSLLDGPGGVDSFGNGWDYLLNPFTSFASQINGADGQSRTTGTVSYSDSVTWVHGNHTWKFGFDARLVKERGFDNFFSRRQITLDPALAFGGYDPGLIANEPADDRGTALIDAANAYWGFAIEDTQNQFFNKGGDRQPTDDKTYRQNEFDWFGQDSWKVRKNLTLNLGLRYQLNGVPYEVNGNASNLFQDPGTYATGQDVVFTLVGSGTGHSLYQPDHRDIEPRIGFAWDPWSDGKTSVRANFGIFHDRVFGNEFGNARANPPFQAQYVNFPFDTLNNFIFDSGFFPAQPPLQVPSATLPDGSEAPGLVIFNQHFRNPASNNWSLDIQRQLPGSNVIDIEYAGALGTHVLGQRDGNPPDPALVQQLYDTVCGDGTPGSGSGPCPSVSSTALYEADVFGLPFNAVNNNAMVQPDYQLTEFNSIYHALKTKFTHRMTHGLLLQASYTYSHALDNGVDPLNANLGARTFPRNSRNLGQSYGNSDNDVRHIFVTNYIWDMPFGRGKGYLNEGLVGRVFEGWQLGGIFKAQTGIPFNVRSPRDSQRTGIQMWAEQIGDPFAAPAAGCGHDAGVGFVFIPNLCAFTNPAFSENGPNGTLVGGISNNARNFWHGPGFWDWDMTFSKTTTITERVKLELRFEGYNVFNHPRFSNPGADSASLGNNIASPLFGVSLSTFTEPDGTTSARQMQVALKLKF